MFLFWTLTNLIPAALKRQRQKRVIINVITVRLYYRPFLVGSRPSLESAGSLQRTLKMSKDRRQCDVGLDQRCRDQGGEIRQKRGDTLVRTLRETYGPEFAQGVRADMRLDTLRERTGDSLSQLVKSSRKGK
jgi:hypothetical protein